jgi:hypothetical protein
MLSADCLPEQKYLTPGVISFSLKADVILFLVSGEVSQTLDVTSALKVTELITVRYWFP